MRHQLLSAFVVLLVAAVGVQLVSRPRPLLIWNSTHSAPTGLYRRSTDAVAKNSWVLIWPPKPAAELAATRGYLPARVPMVKRVAALSGDLVCRTDDTVSINGQPKATALRADSEGRPLPQWSGCARLKDGQLLVLTRPATSFDGRYFGPISASNLVERIEPLWTSSAH
jgi:conjugative transfer signal peptidase TraF